MTYETSKLIVLGLLALVVLIHWILKDYWDSGKDKKEIHRRLRALEESQVKAKLMEDNSIHVWTEVPRKTRDNGRLDQYDL